MKIKTLLPKLLGCLAICIHILVTMIVMIAYFFTFFLADDLTFPQWFSWVHTFGILPTLGALASCWFLTFTYFKNNKFLLGVISGFYPLLGIIIWYFGLVFAELFQTNLTINWIMIAANYFYSPLLFILLIRYLYLNLGKNFK